MSGQTNAEPHCADAQERPAKRAPRYHPRQAELYRKYPPARVVAGGRLYNHYLNVGLDPAMHEQVMDLAEKHQCNVAEMVRTLIQWGMDSCD